MNYMVLVRKRLGLLRGVCEWVVNIFISILALIVSILGLTLSFYVISRNKPKLYIEKDLLEIKKEYNQIWIYFYLSNIGERLTTINKVNFYNPNSRFMPKTTILEVIDQTILGVGENLPTSSNIKRYSPLDFPFLIDSNHTKKILAKLDFSTKDKFNKESNRNQLKYRIRIRYSNKIFECII